VNSDPVKKSSILRAAVPGLLLCTLVLLPFLDKPFTIDDPVFMREAVHALQDPLHPTAFEMVWRNVPERVSDIVPTGPVIAWLLVPAALAVESERVAHLMQLGMLWLAVLSTVALASRLGVRGSGLAAAGVFLAAMPAVLGMAGTAMPDVPAMAFGVAGIWQLVAWSQERRAWQGILATLLLATAALTRTHAVLLVPVAGLFLIPAAREGRGWRDRAAILLPLLVSPVLVALVLRVTRDPAYGGGGILSVAAYYSTGTMKRIASNVTSFPIHWVLSLGFALPWLVLRGRRVARSKLVVVGGAAGGLAAAAALHYVDRLSWPLAAVAGLGVAVLLDPIADGWRRRDWNQLALSAWLLLALAAAPYAHLPAKYLLASAPAAAILLAREWPAASRTVRAIALGGAAVTGVVLAVAVLRADTELAEVGRRAATQLIAPRVAAGQRVWFAGHWGFQWYAEKAGARHATLTAPYPQPGDFAVVSVGPARSRPILDLIANRFPRMIRVAQIEESRPGGRVMTRDLEAGFFSNAVGFLPWTWGDTVVDAYLAFELR